jgi:hypothetical protein
VSITGGTQGGTYTLGGGATPLLVNGSLTVNLGDANNTLSVATNAQVGGDTRVSAGAGNDSIALNGAMFGNLRVSLGNGNDTVNVTSGPGATFFLTAGNGNDSIAITPATGGLTWTLAWGLGTGNDTVNLNAPGGALQGFANSQSPAGDTVTEDVSWTHGSPWSSNFGM